ncbi:MAG: hypothetical protein GX613_09990 [Chloroflexi bacterium]|nr:hypothetical protein [Chloroflexota bacterium]
MLDGEALINTRCTVCHTRARIDDEDEDREDWTAIVDRMISYGAQLSAAERAVLIDYLVAKHGEDDEPDDDRGRGRGRGRGRDSDRDSN